MLTAEIIGYAAGALTTISLMPEIYKTWKTKEARDLSFYWLGTLSAGEVLWVLYGFYISSLPVIIANSVSILLCIIQIALAFKYDNVRVRRSRK